MTRIRNAENTVSSMLGKLSTYIQKNELGISLYILQKLTSNKHLNAQVKCKSTLCCLSNDLLNMASKVSNKTKM